MNKQESPTIHHKDQMNIEPEVAERVVYIQWCASVLFNKFRTNRNVKDFLYYVCGLIPRPYGNDILQGVSDIPNKNNSALREHKTIEVFLYQSIKECYERLNEITDKTEYQKDALMALQMLEKKYADKAF